MTIPTRVAIAHVLLLASVCALYCSQVWIAVVAFGLGLFIRGTSPYREKPEMRLDVLRASVFLGVFLIVRWAQENGASAFLLKLWENRFSPLALGGFFLLLLFYCIKDWRYILSLTSEDISKFFQAKA